MKTPPCAPAAPPGAIIYTVQEFRPPHWTDVLSTRDKAKAYSMAKAIGSKGRVVETGGSATKR